MPSPYSFWPFLIVMLPSGVVASHIHVGQPLAVVTLDLDRVVLQGPARAAEPLHLRDAGLEGGGILCASADHGHRLAVATAAVPEEPHHPVLRRQRAGAGGGGARRRLHRANLAETVGRESLYPRGVVSPAGGREGAS